MKRKQILRPASLRKGFEQKGEQYSRKRVTVEVVEEGMLVTNEESVNIRWQ